MKQYLKEYLKEFWLEVGAAVKAIAIFMLILFGCMMFFGCSPRIVPVSTVHGDTVYINKFQIDSIHVHDSIYINQYVKGDTVFLTQYKYKEYWREKEIHDTLYQSHVDTLTVKITEYKQTSWQEFTGVMGKLFLWLIASCILFGIFWILTYKARIK